ncbi:BnaAnng33450D, partial [Brassica napus]
MCISLPKKNRIEEDELAVYTIFGEMNSIVYILKYSYLCT